ncbi:MAG: hypothetical protein OXD31_06960, partial [Chloroflexi bacterium]|nr:hypothetical protein [Chloroflexota bacterium]
FVGLFALVLILACAAVVAAFRPTSDPGVNLIAFVNADGEVMTMTPDGLQARMINPAVEGFFTWPTWSPDANTIVYSGVIEDGGELQLNLYASDNSGTANRVLYASEPGEVGLLAQGVVHYPLWSPDGNHLAFIATTADGLSLFMDDLRDNPEAQRLLDDGPLWMSWSQDSSSLAVHRGVDHFLIGGDDLVTPQQLNIREIGYRVPALHPVDGSLTLRTQPGALNASVSSVRLDGPNVMSVTPLRRVEGEAAFLWSPTGRHLAVAEATQYLMYRDTAMRIYNGISVLTVGESQDVIELELPVLAYFWSPDGTKIVLVTLSERQTALSWALYDVESDERTRLVDFAPSAEQLTIFQFFDQYAYSHTVWSPDSSSIVFAGDLLTDSVTASLGGHPGHSSFHIVVVDVVPVAEAHVITEGIMGFWSPR